MNSFLWHGNYYVPLGGIHGVGLFAIVDEADTHIVDGRKWTLTTNGYPQSKMQLLHNLVLSGIGHVDHINHNKLDNRRSNLRLIDQTYNNKNVARRSHSSWAYKGVRKTSAGRWQARIRNDKKEIYLGSFLDEVSAAKAFDEAAIKLHGEYAYLNFPEVKNVKSS